MLFGYPVAATQENWFHETLVEILNIIHTNLQNGQNPPDWPDIIPELYRDNLRRRWGLRNRLNTYRVAAMQLDSAGLTQIINALERQNKIGDLLVGNQDCEPLDHLPGIVRESIKDLFEFAFTLLSELGIRDRHYHLIYDSTPYHICPFCGCEYFDAPGAPREALDHYLAESKYPFAGANLCNLVPMGNKCNSKYKLAQDILYNDDGGRRRSFYPYEDHDIQISLDRSEPFARTEEIYPLPQWQIEFIPDSEEISTWDTVFHIRERYQRDILDADFMSWLREFSSWCRSANVKPSTREDVIAALRRYSEHMRTIGKRDRAFLKAALFQMLFHHCNNGNERLVTFVYGVVIGGMA